MLADYSLTHIVMGYLEKALKEELSHLHHMKGFPRQKCVPSSDNAELGANGVIGRMRNTESLQACLVPPLSYRHAEITPDSGIV